MDQRIQNVLGVTLTVFIFILTIAAGGSFLLANGAYKSSDSNKIRVSSEGEVSGAPDIAKFNFTIETEGGLETSEVQQENAQKSKAVIDALLALGVEKEDITTSYSVNPRYQYFNCDDNGTCPPRETVGYTATQRVKVKSRNFEKMGEVLNAAVENGATQISQLSYTIEDPTELRNQAREVAIEKAKEKAKSLAKAGDFKLGKLVAISDSEYGYDEEFQYARTEMALSSDSAESSKCDAYI